MPLPGEAGWARALHSGSSAPSPAPLGSETQQQQQQQQQQHAKRVRDDGHEPTATHDTPLAPLPPSGSPAVLGGIVGGGSSSGLHSFASVGAPPNADAAQLHFPLLVDSEVPVLLRTYPAPPAPRNKSTAAAAAASVSDDMEDEEGGDAPSDHLLRINDIVEVIGIFTADPVLSSFAGSGGGGATGEGKPRQKRPHHHNAAGAAAGAAAASDMDMDGSTASGGGACAECSCDANDDDDAQMGAAAPLLDDPDALAMMTAHNPPPSLVPRVHAVLMRRLSPSYPALARVTLPASRVMWAGSADATSSGTQQQQQQSSSSAGAVVAASPAAAPWSASGAIEKQRDAEAVAAQHMQLVVDAATPLIGSSTSSGPAAVLSALRSAALSTLTHACGGDALVGEYLLLHLVSRVYARRDMYALGKFTLALTGLPECRVAATAAAAVAAAASSSSSSSSSSSIGAAGAAESRVAPTAGSERVPIPLPLEGGASPLACSIARSLSSLLPRLAVLPLRIDVLNSVVCGPLKDALTSRLHSGLLQLPVGTSVLVDETVMNDGECDGSCRLRTSARVLCQVLFTCASNARFSVFLFCAFVRSPATSLRRIPCSVLYFPSPYSMFRVPCSAPCNTRSTVRYHRSVILPPPSHRSLACRPLGRNWGEESQGHRHTRHRADGRVRVPLLRARCVAHRLPRAAAGGGAEVLLQDGRDVAAAPGGGGATAATAEQRWERRSSIGCDCRTRGGCLCAAVARLYRCRAGTPLQNDVCRGRGYSVSLARGATALA